MGVVRGGLLILLLAGFYAAIESPGCGAGRSRSSSSARIPSRSTDEWQIEHFVSAALVHHLRTDPLRFRASFVTVLRGAAVLVVFWPILYWMYRRKIFLKI